MRPTRPLRPVVVLLLLASALVLIGRSTGSGWTMVIVSGLAACLVIATAWPALVLWRCRFILASSPRDAMAGRAFELGLTSTGPRVSVVLTPNAVYVGPSRRHQDRDKPVHPQVAQVRSPAEAQVHAPRRGLVHSVDLEAKCGAPLGLVWWRMKTRVELTRPVEVAPVPIAMAVPTISSGDGGDRHRPERRSGHDSVRTVRDYVPGDSTRLVHWGATARRGQLTVKELEDPEGARLAVVLDLRGPEGPAEQMAARAGGLCRAGLRGGMEVVLCTAERSGPVRGQVNSPTEIGRRLARAVAGPPASAPPHSTVVHLVPIQPVQSAEATR